jgi:DNA-binding GntR family transcriptional regulator
LAKVAKLQREPLTRRAAQAIRDAIFAGEYAPGQRLVEEDLAASLGVSRNVVREAFGQFEAQGLIHSDDYRGKSLATLSVPEMMELIPLRLALESMAVTRASRNITPESAEALRNQVAKFTQPIANFSAYAQIDYDLHQAIWKLAGNRHMHMMLDRIAGPMIALQARIYQPQLDVLVRKETEDREGSHARIVEAIRAGTANRARLAMQKHILAYWQMWLTQAATVEAGGSSTDAIHDAMNVVAAWAGQV